MQNFPGSGGLGDRRRFALDWLNAMAPLPGREHPAGLREIAAGVLGFTAAPAAAALAVPQDLRAARGARLPDRAAVIGDLSNEYGPGYKALHFDLSAAGDHPPQSYVTNASIQAANRVLQESTAGRERYPLLLFTLPDSSGIQFVTGLPVPGNSNRLQEVRRVTAYWNSRYRTLLDCLESVGQAIVRGEVPPQQAFRDGFNVQPVTEQFFADYKRVYDDTVRWLTAAAQRQDAEQFTQTLFNRLLFIQFISRKGWLALAGNSDYLNALWRDYQQNPGAKGNFHADRLSVLFHTGMNTPESERPAGAAALIGQVPFLNGGLFEPNDLDRQGIVVPDDAIAEIIGPRGLFNRYNFTVMEATPLDTEVAVDPEMLGKLFEETVNERHSNGAYYTPRPVVAFMCREALKGYLTHNPAAGLAPERIAALVDGGDAAAVTPAQAAALAVRLGAVKALDPACGSGAFLLGMLQEIMAVNATLFRAGVSPESLYRQKLDLIRRNLHGVDQDANAVHIAMLRLWLSLAVDFDGAGPPPPLPNLDLKLLAGDALTAAAPDAQQQDLTGYAIAAADLGRLIGDYTDANAAAEKERLKGEIAAAKAAIRNNGGPAAPAGAVDWRVDFADVHAGGGFDIVIANPPYVRKEEIQPPEYKKRLETAYKDAAVGNSDLYCYFYARSMQLLKPGGIQAFVCSNSWLDMGYGSQLKRYLLRNGHICAIYESAVSRQFATAQINTIISLIQKGDGKPADETSFIALHGEFESAIADPSQQRVVVKSHQELLAAEQFAGKNGDKWSGKHLRAPDIYHHIMNKAGDKLVRLGDIAGIRRGITTSSNEFFYLSAGEAAEWAIETEFLHPVITQTRQEPTWTINPANLPLMVFICHREKSELRGTNALRYIEEGERRGVNLIQSIKSRRRWYELSENTGLLALGCKVNNYTRTFLNPQGCQLDKSFYGITPKDVAALLLRRSLNAMSSVLTIETEAAGKLGGGLLEIAVYQTENLRIVNPTLIGGIDDSQIFSSKGWDELNPSPARRQLDEAVFDILGLTTGEREAVYAGVRELVENRKRKARSV